MKAILFLLLLIVFSLFSCKDDDVTINFVYPVSSLVIDNSNNLWVGSDAGLFKIATGYEKIDIKNNSPVTALGIDLSGNTLWIGTSTGLSYLSLSGPPFIVDPIPLENLSDPFVNSIFTDSGSVNWFGTGIGITRNSGLEWQTGKFKKNANGTITSASFESTSINSIACWDGDYYFATNGQSMYRAFNWNPTVDAFSGASQLTNPYNGPALTDTMYVVFVDSQGRQWMGGRNGLQVHSGHDSKTGLTFYNEELSNLIIHCIAEAPDGKIWVGTENGISVFDGSNWTTLSSTLPDVFVTAIAFEPNGRAWIGTKKGLVHIN